jgi:hypothetical protein
MVCIKKQKKTEVSHILVQGLGVGGCQVYETGDGRVFGAKISF